MLRAKFEVIKVTHTAEDIYEWTEYLLLPLGDDPKLIEGNDGKSFKIRPKKLRLKLEGPIEKGEGLELGDKVHFYISRSEDSPPSVEYIQEQIDKARVATGE